MTRRYSSRAIDAQMGLMRFPAKRQTIAATARTFDRYGNSDGLTHDALAVEITDRRTGSKTMSQGRMRQMHVDSIACGANLGFNSIVPDTRSTRDDVNCPACLAAR